MCSEKVSMLSRTIQRSRTAERTVNDGNLIEKWEVKLEKLLASDKPYALRDD